MQTPLMQEFILQTDDGRYYKDRVSIYASGEVAKKIIETTSEILKAKRFTDYAEVSELSMSYNFKLIALNTYIEEVN